MQRLLARACVVGLVGLGLLSTATRVRVWTDEQALWRDAVTTAPHKPRPWVNLGRIAALNGDPALAEFAARTAIALTEQPDRSLDEQIATRAYAETNLALVLRQRGAVHEAEAATTYAYLRLPNDPAVVRVYTWFHASGR